MRSVPSTSRLTGVAVLALVSGIAACSPRITPAEAAGVIQRHLTSIAPSGPEGGGWAGVDVRVGRVLAEGASATVHFHVLRDPADAGPEFVAGLESDGAAGWRVARYGPELRERLAVLVSEDRGRRYADLVGALSALQDSAARVARAWSRPRKFATRDVPDTTEARRLLRELARGIPRDTLLAGLRERAPWDPAPFEWGVTDDDPGDGAEIVWIAGTGTDRRVCGQLIGARPPPDWGWLEGRFITCRGAGGRHVDQVRPHAVLAEIDAAGGALVPESSLR